MKITIFIVFALVLITPLAGTAAPLLTEQFNYSAGPLSTAGTWTRIKTEKEAVISDAAAITASGSATGRGLAAVHIPAAGSNYIRGVPGMVTTDGNSVYASLWLRLDRVNRVDTAPEVTFTIARNDSLWPARLYVRAGTDTSHFDIGVSANSPETAVFTPSTIGLNVGQAYFVVLGIDFVAGPTNNVAKIWVNPTTGQASPPLANALAINIGLEPAAPTSIFIRQGNKQHVDFSLDEIRVGNAWTDVTAAGVPVTISSFSID